MTTPLRIVCALLYAVALCTGQTSNASEKIAPVSAPQTAAPPPAASADNKAPADNKANDSKPADAVKPGCEVEKAAPADVTGSKPYVFGPLDVLEIKVWKDQNLSGMFTIGPDGTIAYPLIGRIKVDGLTEADLTKLLRKRLTEAVFECPPDVYVQILKVNSKKVTVYGGVYKQGEFPLLGDMTVMDLLANCGGFKDFANVKKIRIQRGDKTFYFNYRDVSRGRNTSQDIKLQNGDRIFVPE